MDQGLVKAVDTHRLVHLVVVETSAVDIANADPDRREADVFGHCTRLEEHIPHPPIPVFAHAPPGPTHQQADRARLAFGDDDSRLGKRGEQRIHDRLVSRLLEDVTMGVVHEGRAGQGFHTERRDVEIDRVETASAGNAPMAARSTPVLAAGVGIRKPGGCPDDGRELRKRECVTAVTPNAATSSERLLEARFERDGGWQLDGDSSPPSLAAKKETADGLQCR